MENWLHNCCTRYSMLSWSKKRLPKTGRIHMKSDKLINIARPLLSIHENVFSRILSNRIKYKPKEVTDKSRFDLRSSLEIISIVRHMLPPRYQEHRVPLYLYLIFIKDTSNIVWRNAPLKTMIVICYRYRHQHF